MATRKNNNGIPKHYGTATVRAAVVERSAVTALSKTTRIKQFAKRVAIEVVVYREKCGDPDNCCAKSEIDGIVGLGILRDDSSKEVDSVTFRERPASENDDPNNLGKEGSKIIITEVE